MKKRLGMLMLALCLLFPPITVNAEEKDVTKGISGYINLLLAKTKGESGGESIISLKDTLEEIIQKYPDVLDVE